MTVEEMNKELGLFGKLACTGETMTTSGTKLYRITALKSFGSIHARAIGGWIQHPENIGLNDNSWIEDEATVREDAKVRDNATISGECDVFGRAVVTNNAKLSGNVRVGTGCYISGDTVLNGDVSVPADAVIKGNAIITKQSDVATVNVQGLAITLYRTATGIMIGLGNRTPVKLGDLMVQPAIYDAVKVLVSIIEKGSVL